MTSLVDLFPYLRQGCRRELVLLAICTTCCLLGFSLVTEVGPVHWKETYSQIGDNLHIISVKFSV